MRVTPGADLPQPGRREQAAGHLERFLPLALLLDKATALRVMQTNRILFLRDDRKDRQSSRACLFNEPSTSFVRATEEAFLRVFFCLSLSLYRSLNGTRDCLLSRCLSTFMRLFPVRGCTLRDRVSRGKLKNGATL